MKKFIDKIQDLSQKAAQVRQAVQSAPAAAAQIRDAVVLTAGQLQQLRTDVQSSVVNLRADNETRLTTALQEIHDNAGVFRAAGYELTGVEVEISPAQRVIVHLEKVDDVSDSSLRSLLNANTGQPTTHALLTSLIKAEEMADDVTLTNLHYRELIVHVGPTPAVRLCWRTNAVAEPPGVVTAAAPVPSRTNVPSPATVFEQSSFFERRPTAATEPQVAAVTPPPPVLVSPPPATKTPEPAAQTPGSDWRRAALDRFKRMPEFSKYRR